MVAVSVQFRPSSVMPSVSIWKVVPTPAVRVMLLPSGIAAPAVQPETAQATALQGVASQVAAARSTATAALPPTRSVTLPAGSSPIVGAGGNMIWWQAAGGAWCACCQPKTPEVSRGASLCCACLASSFKSAAPTDAGPTQACYCWRRQAPRIGPLARRVRSGLLWSQRHGNALRPVPGFAQASGLRMRHHARTARSCAPQQTRHCCWWRRTRPWR